MEYIRSCVARCFYPSYQEAIHDDEMPSQTAAVPPQDLVESMQDPESAQNRVQQFENTMRALHPYVDKRASFSALVRSAKEEKFRDAYGNFHTLRTFEFEETVVAHDAYTMRIKGPHIESEKPCFRSVETNIGLFNRRNVYQYTMGLSVEKEGEMLFERRCNGTVLKQLGPMPGLTFADFDEEFDDSFVPI